MFETGLTIAVDGAALFVAEAGRPDGRPMLLLHGGLGSRTDFIPLAEELGSDFRLVALDSRGHGCSSMGTARLSYGQLEADAMAVIDALGLEGCGIIGHSDGGIVGLRLAAAGRTRLDFVVAAGAHWCLPWRRSCGPCWRSVARRQGRLSELPRAGRQRRRARSASPGART